MFKVIRSNIQTAITPPQIDWLLPPPELWWLSGGKRGDYQNCSMLYCVLKLCTAVADPGYSWGGFVFFFSCRHTSPNSTPLQQYLYKFLCLWGGGGSSVPNEPPWIRPCTVISTLRWAVLTVLWIGFCLASPISLCLDSFVFMFVCFCVYLVMLHMCCIIVTWWGGPGKIEA